MMADPNIRTLMGEVVGEPTMGMAGDTPKYTLRVGNQPPPVGFGQNRRTQNVEYHEVRAYGDLALSLGRMQALGLLRPTERVEGAARIPGTKIMVHGAHRIERWEHGGQGSGDWRERQYLHATRVSFEALDMGDRINEINVEHEYGDTGIVFGPKQDTRPARNYGRDAGWTDDTGSLDDDDEADLEEEPIRTQG
jgi:single-stranded DNA-binding protein